MSDGQKRFEYTKGKFWGEPTADFLIYRILAILPFTGLIGLDHLYLRSPGTFLLKALLNVLTLGSWYFYDVIQAMMFESDEVGKYGLSAPLKGPLGIGAGIFKDVDGEYTASGGAQGKAPSSLKYLIFSLLTMFGFFGVDYIYAGDWKGWGHKIIFTYLIGLLGIIGFIFGLINIYRLLFTPEKVFIEGTARYFPASSIIGKNFPSEKLVSPIAAAAAAAASKENTSGTGFFLDTITGFFNKIRNAALPPINNTIDIVTKIPEEVNKIASIAASTNPSMLLPTIPQIEPTFPPLGPFTGPAAPMASAPPYPGAKQGTMVGGGADKHDSPLMILIFGILFIGGFFMAGKRAITAYTESVSGDRPPSVTDTYLNKAKRIVMGYKNEEREENVSDTPPRPSESRIF